jgi:YggT family protein
MFGDIAGYLLEIFFSLFGAALILRAWLHAVRLHPFNPLSRLIFQVTNWLIQPLQKILPPAGRVDWASILAVWLAALVYLLLMWLIAAGSLIPPALLPSLAVKAVLTVIGWTLRLIIWMTLIQAVLSWVNPMSPAMPILRVLTDPLLNPIRQILPRAGIDFSPLALLVIAQVLMMMLTRVNLNPFVL